MPATAAIRSSRPRRLADRALELVESPRFAARALAVAIVIYAALVLWLTRGASFTFEEITYVGGAKGFDLREILMPYNGGHLIAVTRLLFEVNLRIFGPEQLPFQLVVIALTATTSALVFALMRPRVGPLPALAAAVVLLFMGTTPEVIHGWATMWVQATAAGLGGLLALERRSRNWDVVACVLFALAIASFSVGVALALAAVAFLFTAGERRRLWVPLVPLALYVVWWAWAQQFDAGNQSFANLLIVPVWTLDSLAAGAAALTGVGVDLTREPVLWSVALGWGRIVAVALIVVAAFGIRRRGASPLLWAALTFLVVLFVAQALSYSWTALERRTPDLDRYAYPIAIGIVLVLAASFRGWRPSRTAALAILALAVFALPVNLWMLRERGTQIRTESDLAKARMTAIEIERDIVPPDLVATGFQGGFVTTRASDYLAAVDRFGTFGYSITALTAAPEGVRTAADETLGAIVAPKLEPARGGSCTGGGPVELNGRTLLRSRAGGTVELRRFADAPVVTAGTLEPGQVAAIDLPTDAASQPWIASVAAGDLQRCEPRGSSPPSK
jgi:hypothetical protein